MVQIEVLQVWTGEPSGFRQIVPGVYDAKDERLYGCAGYLLEYGYARRVESETPAATSDEVDEGTDAGFLLGSTLPVPEDEPEITESADEPTPDTDDPQDEPKQRRRSK